MPFAFNWIGDFVDVWCEVVISSCVRYPSVELTLPLDAIAANLEGGWHP